MNIVLLLMLSIMGITGIAILGSSIYRKDGKWKCLLTNKQKDQEAVN